jgi:O-antigen/teichoic acid export membrane protein
MTRERHGARRESPRRHVFGTAGTNLLITGIGGMGGLILARSLGPANVGRLVPVIQWPAMIASFASLGLTQAVTFHVSRAETSEQADTYIGTGVVACLITGALIAVFAWPLARMLGSHEHVETLVFVTLLLSPVYIVGGFWNSALQAVDIFGFNVTRAVQPVAYFIGVAGLAAAGGLRLGTVVATLVSAQALMIVCLYPLAARRFRPWGSWSTQKLRDLYSYGVKIALTLTPRNINIQLDLLVLSVTTWVTSAALGSYSVAASLTWLVLPISSAFGTVGFPLLARTADRGAQRDVERRALLGALVCSGGVIVVIATAAHWAIPFAFGSKFNSAVVVVWLLAPGAVALAVNQVAGDLLCGRGLPLRAATGELAGAAATLVLLPVLAPRMGIRGAALVSDSAYLLSMVILLAGLRRPERGDAVPDGCRTGA